MIESVLFVCDNNSILSPMAEAFLRRHGRAAFKVYSAGIEPKPIHLYTFQVMEEIGHDLYGYRAKSIFELNHLQRVDSLITLSDYVKEFFVFNQNNIGTYLHWPLRNPFLIQEKDNKIDPQQISTFSPDEIHLPILEEKISSGKLLLRIDHKTRTAIHMQPQEISSLDMREILSRFRRTRDELECQIMNWLEEKGIGPLWWRG